MIELIVVVAVIGIIMVVAMPAFLSYWRTSTLRAGAEEFAAILNNARQLAIKENQTVCVTQSAGAAQYRVGGCGAAVWTGAGTDGSGNFRLQNAVIVSGATNNVTFTYLGAAGTAGTYTITNPVDSGTLTVTVATTGRVTIP